MIEFSKLGTVIRYEFLKHFRRKRLYVILALTLIAELAVIILMPVLMDKYPDDVMVMAAMLTVGPSLASIGAVFFAGDAIAGEFEGKTGFILFTNPIKRVTLITGKYLAGCIAIILVVIFAYLVTDITLLAIYGELPGETFQSFGLCVFYSCSVISITFFFSAISKGSMGATVITLVLLMVISQIVQTVLTFAGKPYWYLPSTGGDSIARVYGGSELFQGGFSGGGASGFGSQFLNFQQPSIGLIAIGTAAYLVVCFAVSLWISRRRQLA